MSEQRFDFKCVLRSRLNKILELHGQALTEAVGQRESMSTESQLSSKDLVQRFAENDPTDGKSRTQWLVKTYIKDEQFKLEDLGRVHAALSAFERFKRKLPIEQRELSRLKKLRDLEALVDPFVKAEERARLTRDLSTATGREKRRLEEWKARDESIIVQEGKGLPTIAVPMTEFASCWWGRGTQWCTAADKNNAFSKYHKEAPLVIIVCPDGAKFQINVTEDDVTFMDNKDNTVGEETIRERWSEFQSLLYWAIQQNGESLLFVPEKFRTPELCRLAVEQNGSALFHVPSDLKSSRGEDQKTPELCRLAIEQNGEILREVSHNYRTLELCRLAVEQNGMALGYVPDEHRTSELCRLAVEQNGMALQHVLKELKTFELCKAAVEQSGMALYHVPKDYKTPELCRLAVKQNGMVLGYVPEQQRTPELCRLAMEQNGRALANVPNKYQNKELYRLAVEQNGMALRYIPDKYKTLELSRIAVEQNGQALYCVLKEHQTPELYRLAVEQNGETLAHIPEEDRTPSLCQIAVERNREILKFVPEKYRTPELLALIPPSQPKWHPDILQGLGQQSQPLDITQYQDDKKMFSLTTISV
jgi:Domain of unknown function (DUF4116)